MINKAIIVGYVGRDPETRYTQGGDAISNFSVATTEKWKKDGQPQERTEWHRITTWGKLAEIVGEHVKKGSLIYIEGKIQTRKWQDKDGTDRYTTEIRADQVKFLNRAGGDRDEDSTPSRGQQDRPPAGKKPASPAAGDRPGKQTGFEDMPDDIPF